MTSIMLHMFCSYSLKIFLYHMSSYTDMMAYFEFIFSEHKTTWKTKSSDMRWMDPRVRMNTNGPLEIPKFRSCFDRSLVAQVA